MLCENSHAKSERLAQIRTTVAEIQHFFYGIVFSLAHPVESFLLRDAMLSAVFAVVVLV